MIDRMTTYTIREAGKNGSVEVRTDCIVRTIKHRLGKDDVQTIPLRGITSVAHNRKMAGTDIVTVNAGAQTFQWKVKDAESMTAAVNAALLASHQS